MAVRNKFAAQTRMWLALFILLFVCSLYVAAQPPLPLMPRDGIELLENGSFEIDANEDRIPDWWTGEKTSHTEPDRQKCSDYDQGKIYAYVGECAFVFQGNPDGSSSSLQQTLNGIDALTDGAQVVFSAYIDPHGGKAGTAFGKAQIQYSDGSIQKFELNIPATVEEDYKNYILTEHVKKVKIPSGATISKVTVKFVQNASSGRFFIDAASFGLFPDYKTMTPTNTPTPDPTPVPNGSKLIPHRSDIYYFGQKVLISGDGKTALVQGANYHNYVFIQKAKGWVLQGRLVPASGGVSAYFGQSLALSHDGNTIIVGEPGALDNFGGGQGAAYIFTRSNGKWKERAKLTPSDNAIVYPFGTAVALSGNGMVALVGAGYSRIEPETAIPQGGAYIFTRNGNDWTQRAKLKPDNAEYNYSFGTSVALNHDGTTAIIGATREDVDGEPWTGAAYVFKGSGSSWIQQKKLVDSNGQQYDQFGSIIALSGDGNTLLIADPYEAFETDSKLIYGTVYVYVRSGTTWTLEKKLKPKGNGKEWRYFGSAIALSSDGNTALVSSPFEKKFDDNLIKTSVYVFKRNSTGWEQKKSLTHEYEDNTSALSFGNAIAINQNGRFALIGAYQDMSVGAVYVFDLTQP